VLPSEIVVYEYPNKDKQSGKITAYDRDFSFSSQSIDKSTFGIGEEIQNFECIPELNVFLSLSAYSVGKDVQKQITVFRGGAMADSMKRVLFSIFGVKKEVVAIESYAHFDKVVILPFTSDNKILEPLINVDTLSPSLATNAQGIDVSKVGQTIPFTVTITNSGANSATINGSLKVLEPLKTDVFELRG
jgi:hypothetical protein